MKEVNFKARRRGDTLELLVYDVIGRSFFSDGITAKQVANALGSNPNVKTIRVRINSPGGSVWDGAAIFSQLRSHGATVEVDVDGLAASAASVIMMAGDKRRVSPAGNVMVHNPWTITIGDHNDHLKSAEFLKKVKESAVAVYADKTGVSKDDLVQMMDDETWMTAKDAVAQGFADEVAEAPPVENSVDQSKFAKALSAFGKVPEHVLSQFGCPQHIANKQAAPSPFLFLDPFAMGHAEESPAPVGANNAPEKGASTRESHMKEKLAKLLSKDADCSEDSIVNAVEQLIAKSQQADNDIKSVLAACDTDNVEGAIGVIKAGQSAAENEAKLEAELKALKDDAETKERARLEASLAGRVSKEELDELVPSMSLEQLRTFARVRAKSKLPLATEDNVQEPDEAAGGAGGTTALTWNGKTFSQLSPKEMKQLHTEDVALYRRMRDKPNG